MTDILLNIIIWAPAILFAITLHEWAHGYMANHFGDPTARMLGRLTLNPIPHIDLMWTIIIPLTMLVVSLSTTGHAFVFGGAKPVPINPRHLKGNPRWTMFWVSAAGPLVNLLLATGCALAVNGAVLLPDYFAVPLASMLVAAIQMNVLLAVFNLLPIPPLDGGRVAVALLPTPFDRYLAGLERFGLPLVILLAFSGVLWLVLMPVLKLLLNLFFILAGLD